MDFIVDGRAAGRMVRILSVVYASRECAGPLADTSLSGDRVTRAPERLIAEHDRPDSVIQFVLRLEF